jgi:hypothetical protein
MSEYEGRGFRSLRDTISKLTTGRVRPAVSLHGPADPIRIETQFLSAYLGYLLVW